ncbi:MAG: hypothetical protein JNK42_00025 [Caedimonas sp.]|jgi:hypothetical protein|nr:hypothetical protein [Caedimonas sp.]
MNNNRLEQQIAALLFAGDEGSEDPLESYFNEPAPVFNKATLAQKLACRM